MHPFCIKALEPSAFCYNIQSQYLGGESMPRYFSGSREHLNQDNIPVLYPKRARDFYPLSPMEYRTLIAYQKAQGDRKEVRKLLKVWRTQPVVVEEDARLFARQNSNLLRKLGIFLFRITASLLAMFLEIFGKPTNNKVLNALAQWLKIQGINRTFWIYQECEAAKRRLIATEDS